MLWYNILDGSDWEVDKLVPNTTLLDGPTPVVIGSNIVIYYQGTDDLLFYNTFDGTKWAGDERAPNVGIGYKSAVVVT